MKSRLINVLFLLSAICLLLFIYRDQFAPSVQTTRAFGELKADFGVARGIPVFKSLRIAPGESDVKAITVMNEGNAKKFVSFKGIRTSTNVRNMHYENIIQVSVDDDSGTLYGKGSATGTKTLTNFFIDSKNPYGIMLSTIDPGKSKTYFISVSYPDVSGNTLENSIIFDISIDAITI